MARAGGDVVVVVDAGGAGGGGEIGVGCLLLAGGEGGFLIRLLYLTEFLFGGGGWQVIFEWWVL